MRVIVSQTKAEMARKAAGDGATLIRNALQARGEANIVLATGASQFEMLENLVRAEGMAWNRVTAFQLDEYVNLPVAHRGSLRLYLWRRFVTQLPLPLRAYHGIDSEAAAEQECRRLDTIIREHPIDVAFIGIGENGHLAFNDPPADFETEKPYIVLHLDERCRRQQFGEGWFSSFEEVPRQGLSMSIRQIMKSKAIICTVPDERKAEAVRNAIEGPVTPLAPASVLQQHDQATIYLDPPAASFLQKKQT